MALTYKEAKKELKRVGAGHCTGDAYLLCMVQIPCAVHAFSEQLLYEGAVKTGISGDNFRKLTTSQQSDLQWA